MSSNRNHTLDILKLFASYMVVFIHVPFHGELGDAIDALARFSVPLFFTISGFYSYHLTSAQIKKRINHILHLLILAVPTYLLWQAVILFSRHGIQGLAQLINQYFDIRKLLNLFVFNLSGIIAQFPFCCLFVLCVL